MRRFSLITVLMLSAVTAEAQSADAWFGVMAQGRIEGYILSSDEAATLSVACTMYDETEKAGLAVFLDQVRPEGDVSISVDGAEAMTFAMDSAEFAAGDASRDALFKALIAGSKADVTLSDGKAFSFSLSGSSEYLEPCL